VVGLGPMTKINEKPYKTTSFPVKVQQNSYVSICMFWRFGHAVKRQCYYLINVHDE